MSTTKPTRRSSPPTTTSPSRGQKPASPSSSSSTASKRLLQELHQLHSESQGPPTRPSPSLSSGNPPTTQSTERSPIERLGPINDDDFFHWEAVINGRGLGNGYDEGRWLLDIHIPGGESGGGASSYPNRAPEVKFLTRVVAANVGFENGEVCLDLLKDAWSPAYTLKMTVEAIWQMLAAPGVDSPLNVDVAALLRQGDRVAAEAVVRWGCQEWKYEGS